MNAGLLQRNQEVLDIAYLASLNLLQMKKTKPTHGGKRKGSGRKPKEPTVVMRIPVSLVEKVKALIEKYKG